MRLVVMADLFCAGRAVMAVSPGSRRDMARALIRNADVADRFRENCGRQHALFGDGTLDAAARHAGMVDDQVYCCGDFAKALILVLQVLVDHARVE